MSRERSRWLVPALLLGGVALMLPFEATLTRALGVALLLGFIVVGVFAIATPEFLERDEGEEEG